MLPSPTSNNATNRYAGDVVLLRDNVCFNVSAVSNLKNIQFCKFCLPMFSATWPRFQKYSVAVTNIFRLVAPFEIDCSIVCFVAIFVVKLRLVFSWIKEGFSNQSCYLESVSDSVFAQLSNAIALWCGELLYYLLRRFAPYSSKIRNAVEIVIARYCFPNFGGRNCVRHIGLSIQRLVWLGVRGDGSHSYACSFFTSLMPRFERQII